MTPAEFVEEIRKLHTPYLPRLVTVNGVDPTDEDKAAAVDWLCDACKVPASRCLIAPLLALVDGDWPTDYADHTQTCEDLDQRPEDVA